MAITPTYTRLAQGDGSIGNFRAKRIDVTLSGTYATGGFAMPAGDVGIGNNLAGVVYLGEVVDVSGHTISGVVYRFDTGNLMLFDASTGLEVANATSLAGCKLKLMIFGF